MASLSLNKTIKLEKKLETFHKASQKHAVTGLSANLNVLIAIARKVGNSLIRDYNELESLQIAVKTPAQFIATTESNCRAKLQTELSKARPGYGFLFRGEKEIEGEDTSHRFICDPLNGRLNFSHSLPLFCVSIALERNREIIDAAIYNPITDELFYAEKSGGTFMATGRGNKRLRVSQRKDMDQAILAVSTVEEAGEIKPEKNIRIIGSPALTLAYVAAGKIDAYWESGLNPWDTAAGMLLVREAGGHVSTPSVSTAKDKDIVYASDILAGNDFIVKKIKGK